MKPLKTLSSYVCSHSSRKQAPVRIFWVHLIILFENGNSNYSRIDKWSDHISSRIVCDFLTKQRELKQKELEFKLDRYKEFLSGFAEIAQYNHMTLTSKLQMPLTQSI